MAIETPNPNETEKKSSPPENPSNEPKKSEDDVLTEDEPENDKIDQNNTANKSENAEKGTEPPKIGLKSEENPSNQKKKPTLKEKLKNAVTEIKKKADTPPEPKVNPMTSPKFEPSDLEKIAIQNESNTSEPTKEELEQIKSESASLPPLEHPNKDHIKSNIITIKVKIGDHVKENTVDANISEFCVVCRGYDKKEKRYCYRYLDNLTIMQANRFEKFLNKHGCMCGEQIDITITPKSILDEINKAYPVNPRRFEEKFIEFYFKKINFPAISLKNDP